MINMPFIPVGFVSMHIMMKGVIKRRLDQESI
jgi:hypothetical protein